MVAGERLLWWWYRLRWWTPESRAWRAYRQHGKAVYDEMMRRGLDGSHAEQATKFVFGALHRRYCAGQQIADVRQFAVDVTFAEFRRRRREQTKFLEGR